MIFLLIAAFLALAIRLAQAALFRFPCFLSYVVILLAYLICWWQAMAHPPGLGCLPIIEPALIGCKALAFMEAFRLASQRLAASERRVTMALLLIFATVAMLVVYIFGDYERPYQALRAYGNLALAISSVAACGYWWIAPWKMAGDVRRHCVILTAYLVNLATWGIVVPAHGRTWRMMNEAAMAGSLVCAGCWLWSLRRI